jgi:hypothetical protein
MMKDLIVRWAIKQIVADSEKTFGGMRYLEDASTNKFGEKEFIFNHKFVPVDKKKMDAYNASQPKGVMAFKDTSEE